VGNAHRWQQRGAKRDVQTCKSLGPLPLTEGEGEPGRNSGRDTAKSLGEVRANYGSPLEPEGNRGPR